MSKIVNVRRRGGRVAVGLAAGAALVSVGSVASAADSGAVRTTSKAAAPIVLTVEDSYTSDPANSTWNTLFAQYHKLHPNVTINRTTVPQAQYLTHVLDQAGSNSLPDVMMLDNSNLAQIAATGVLAPLESIGNLNTSGIASSELFEGTYKNKLYALPLYTNTTALFYNKKIFAAAHLSPPKTWAQLESDAKALTTSSRFGFVTTWAPASTSALWLLLPYLWSNGGGNVLNNLSSPQAVAALNVFVTMERDGSMPKSSISWAGAQADELFDTGKAAMEQTGSWVVSSKDAVKGLDYGTAVLPVRVPGQKLLVPTGGEVWTIPKSSNTAAEKAALQLFKWMESPSVDVKEAVMQGGLIPTVKAAIPAALKEEDPVHMAAFATELENGGTPRTKYLGNPKSYSAIATNIGNATDAAIIGPTTAQQAFGKIASQVLAEEK
ncbi:MAG: putative sugar transporter, substrate binding protein [Acidimicrobiaceae bacterium]|nr:putative sugar transporter, substrate binding protein [Acidimicrobiaceae bacterium]